MEKGNNISSIDVKTLKILKILTLKRGVLLKLNKKKYRNTSLNTLELEGTSDQGFMVYLF